MKYYIELNEEERNLLLIDLLEMCKQEGFYDREQAAILLHKVVYAKTANEE